MIIPRDDHPTPHIPALPAAAYAGYAHPWARNQGYRLMRQPAIQARVAGHVGATKAAMTTNDDISAPIPGANRSDSRT